MKREVLHLVGDFSPSVLDRWTRWAARNHYTVRHTTLAELDGKLYGKNQPVIIMDEHGLNDLHLPETTP